MAALTMAPLAGMSVTSFLQEFAGMSAEDIARKVDLLDSSRPQPAMTSVIVANGTPAVVASKNRSKKTVAKKHRAASARPSNSIAPSRPLNAFIGFRGNYSRIFVTYQQKNISGILTVLWQSDAFKAKWSIVAKAYSIIREHNTKAAAPLNKFLDIVCPRVGIIPKDDYLAVMGWEIVEEDGEMRMERRFIPDIASFPDEILTTNLSADDVVAFCYHVGYVKANNSVMHSNTAADVLTMAALPASSSTQAPALVPAALPQAPASVPAVQSQAPVWSPAIQEELALGARMQAALNENNNNAAGASSALRQTVHDLSGQQYPFHGEFDPYGMQPLMYDPFAANNDAAFSTGSLGTYLAPAGAEFPETYDVGDFLTNEMFEVAK